MAASTCKIIICGEEVKAKAASIVATAGDIVAADADLTEKTIARLKSCANELGELLKALLELTEPP